MRTDPACPGVAANACQRVEAQHNMPAVPGIPPLPDRGPHEGNRWDAKRHRHVQRPGIVAHQNAALRKPCRELADILRDTLHDVRACPGEHAAQDRFVPGAAEQDDPVFARLHEPIGQGGVIVGRPSLGLVVRTGMDGDKRAGPAAFTQQPPSGALDFRFAQEDLGAEAARRYSQRFQRSQVCFDDVLIRGRPLQHPGQKDLPASAGIADPLRRAGRAGDPRGFHFPVIVGIDRQIEPQSLQFMKECPLCADAPGPVIDDDAVDTGIVLQKRRCGGAGQNRQFRRGEPLFEGPDGRRGKDQIADAVDADEKDFSDALSPQCRVRRCQPERGGGDPQSGLPQGKTGKDDGAFRHACDVSSGMPTASIALKIFRPKRWYGMTAATFSHFLAGSTIP